MLLGNKQYNRFLPYFFHAEVDKKVLWLYWIQKLHSSTAKICLMRVWIWWYWTVFSQTKMHCLWRRDKSQTVSKDYEIIVLNFRFYTFTYKCRKKSLNILTTTYGCTSIFLFSFMIYAGFISWNGTIDMTVNYSQ